MSVKINIGCGRTPTEGWRNFDNTLAIRLARSPLKYFLAKFFGLLNKTQIENIKWNKKNSIEFADATKSIPLPNASVSCIYTSHMFEHLSREGGEKFLKEALRVLEVDGVLRISVPDLKKYIEIYLKNNDADQLMEDLLVTAPPVNTLKQKLRLFVSGYRHHQWMYDGNSLANLMTELGFRNVKVQEAGKTLVNNPGALNLSERSEQSLYVEGVK
jgi:predicted SAM-dependent methyltransferase